MNCFDRQFEDDRIWEGMDAPRSRSYRTKPNSPPVKWIIALYEAIREDREYFWISDRSAA